ncbi:hypothetical protein [Sphingomonas pseudosanguinis]|uniref:Uncharacterized protein n=1 Tax=Sphingomonas pseudosanguinis TaxID=413712 RepID=A0A7W6F3U0_9SPHN|nr:hypothetical protein [Sphingomonas pseudosanguinis]MBB3880379.1 hypothetical protein [Sphingomonas pseudosanguinis]MBN3535662.1 hypothetical protein [Sphingomonas pseudosanguinis]
MSQRKSKWHPNLSVRLSDPDHAFLDAVREMGDINKSEAVIALFRLGRALGPLAVLEAARHQKEASEKQIDRSE